MPECAALSGGDDADVTLLLSPSCQPCSCPERGFYKCSEARCGEVRTGWFPAAPRGEGRGGRSAIARSEPGAELGHAQPGKNVVFSSCKDNSVLEKTLGSCCLCPSFRWAHLVPRCRGSRWHGQLRAAPRLLGVPAPEGPELHFPVPGRGPTSFTAASRTAEPTRSWCAQGTPAE